MRRLIWITAAGVALTSASLAIADNIGTKAVKAVGATFSATGVSSLRTQECATATGTLVTTAATYAGTVQSSEPALNGPLTLRVQTLVNTQTNLGVVSGTLRVQPSGQRGTLARLDAVYANGQLNGLLQGSTQTQGTAAKLVANFSGSFSPAAGLTGGKIGEAAAGGGAVMLQLGRCTPTPTTVQGQVTAEGPIAALTPTSITVGGVTCAISAGSLNPRVMGISVGVRVAITCRLVNGTLTLVKVQRKGVASDR
jgi:hypothetical protein